MVDTNGTLVRLVVGRVHRGKWSEWRELARAEMDAAPVSEPHPDLFPELPPVPPAPVQLDRAA